MKHPRLSVIMPVHNGASYLDECIQSVLNQTYTDFEFIIIDDGSTDNSIEIIERFTDPRIKLHKIASNKGLIFTLNKALDLNQSEYIARMDADDICIQTRFEKQIQYLESHPEVGVCGSWYRMFGDYNTIIRTPQTFNEIQLSLLFDSAIGHPTAMFRNSIITTNHIRYRDILFAEDYYLWTELSKVCELTNIPEVLLLYRCHKMSVSNLNREAQIRNASIIRASYIKQSITREYTENIIAIASLSLAYRNQSDLSKEEFSQVNAIYMELFEFIKKADVAERKKYTLRLLTCYVSFIFDSSRFGILYLYSIATEQLKKIEYFSGVFFIYRYFICYLKKGYHFFNRKI